MRAFIARWASGVLLSSWAVGVGQNQLPGSRERIDGVAWFAFAVGVCNREESPSEVRRTNGGRWYAIPFDVIPARGQVGEDVSKPKSKVPWDILQQRPFGS